MDEVYRLIPHRPPFLFIDEIVEEGEGFVVARREVREDEPQFEGHYPGNPIMPGVLLCEAAFQTAGILLVKRFEAEGEQSEGLTPVLTRIREAKFKSMVKPGDVIEIEVKYLESVSKFHFLRGVIRRDKKIVCTVEFSLAMIDE